MHILALVTDGFGGHGGIARYNRDLLTALSACSTVSRVIALPRHAAAPPGTMPAKVRQAAPVESRAAYIAAAIRAARQHGPFDTILCGHLYMAPLAAMLASAWRRPLWLQVHGIEAWDRPGALVRKATARAGMVTSVSRYTRRRFLGWADVAPEIVRVLPNTFDASFTPGKRSAHLERQLGVEGRRVLLTVSRLDERESYKGIDRVLRALPRVLARYPDAVYVVAGEGSDRPRLHAMAVTIGVADHVRFTGHVPPDALADHYRLADAFVMPSTGEGFGIVFLEAAAAGLPVIGGHLDGSTDALADGAIGTLVDPRDDTAIADALISALDRGRIPVSQALDRFARSRFEAHVGRLVEALAA